MRNHLCLLILFTMTTLSSMVTIINAYMNEPYSPFIITSPKHGQIVKPGDTVKITW